MNKIIDSVQKINAFALKNEILLWCLSFVPLYFFAKNFDAQVFVLVEKLHEIMNDFSFEPLFKNFNEIVIFLTEKGLNWVFYILAAATVFRVWKSKNSSSALVPVCLSCLFTGIIVIVAKSFFAVPRPFTVLHLIPLVEVSTNSFPSGHTAMAFALFVPLYRISRKIGLLWAFFATLVGTARIYEFVHYPSDIAGGILFGGIIGAFVSHPTTSNMIKHWWKFLEFRRQIFHFSLGFLCVFMHWRGILRIREILIILILGLIISYISTRKKIPIISKFLELFDRPRDHQFPGRGAFYFILSVAITFLIFPVKIAYAAILTLAVGDSLNHLIGKIFARNLFLPWNKQKSILGLIIGIATATFASQFFVPFFHALLAISIALLFESIRFRIGSFYIDDNLTVPAIAGGIMFLLS